MAIPAQFYSDNFGLCLGASQDSLMENGCGFDNLCLTPQQQQQFMQFDHQFHNFPNQKNLNFFVDNNNINNNAQFQHPQTAPFSAHIEKQRHEFEQFLNLQNERLRLALQEQRKQQDAILLKKYESKTRFLLTQKDEEIAKASNRNKELQNLLRKMEMERHVWQSAANENESMVASLNGLIQRLRESVCLSENAAEDAESCCPNTAQEGGEGENSKLTCKCCNSRNCCVVMLPCRHLSCCQDCEVFLDSCPVCRMDKKASIEALI